MLSLFPKNKQFLKSLAETFMEDDKKYVDAFLSSRQEKETIGGNLVGCAKVEEKGKSDILIMIIKDDDFFSRESPLENDKIICGSSMRLFDDSIIIAINKKAYDYFFNPRTQRLIETMIAHEVGHVLCGHLIITNKIERNVDPMDRNPIAHKDTSTTEDIIKNIILPILDGYYGDECELEADIAAAYLMGDVESVIFLRDYLSHYSQNIGIRMINQNRASYLLHLLMTEPEKLSFKRELVFYMNIYSDDEIKSS